MFYSVGLILMHRLSELNNKKNVWRKTAFTPAGLLLVVMLLIPIEQEEDLKERHSICGIMVCVQDDLPAHHVSSQGRE